MKRKGVILSGGKGTRLYPCTNVTSKQLLPVYDKPMIYYPLSVLMLAGIKEIMIVSTQQDLHRFQDLFQDGSSLGIKMSYGVQEVPRGIADAFLVAEGFIGKDNVALILGDNIFYGYQLKEIFHSNKIAHSGATIFGYEVTRPERYGVLRFDRENRPIEILEKPESPPSNYAVTGLYYYDNQVIEIAKQLKPSHRGELEITDVNNVYLQMNKLDSILLGAGFAWFDTGTFDDLHEASSYVKILQETHSQKIACIEEIAYTMGYIDTKQFQSLIQKYKGCEYGHYLEKIRQRNHDGQDMLDTHD